MSIITAPGHEETAVPETWLPVVRCDQGPKLPPEPFPLEPLPDEPLLLEPFPDEPFPDEPAPEEPEFPDEPLGVDTDGAAPDTVT
ncbi:hypothetical protein EFY87_00455 [Flexivirga caeni]|uniref:Uncharacterized protein n=1 Tax=Flexivirga caeni TaxID=2294115 RepID=A0A3M9MI01_9MICO|nr:hypothetical protein EFY87_00455 [Flexivirga caeni]